MVDQARSSIVIDAPKDAVMAVIADFPAYPTWSSQVKSVEVVSTDEKGRGTQARFVIDAGVMRDEYTLAYDWSVPDAVSWRLTSGHMQKAQEGSYTLHAVDNGTEVVYELAVELAVPMLGLFRRKAEKLIIDIALKGLKRHVEQTTG